MDKELLRKCLDYHDKYPFDPVHDRFHHQRVINNILKIIKTENIDKKLRLQPLIFAAALHDAVDEKRGKVEPQLGNLRHYLKHISMESSLSFNVIKILSGHSFGHNQKSLEEKVLYDADKIEFSSVRRVDYSVRAVRDGKISDEKLKYYFRLWADRILKVYDTLHFGVSKKMFLNNSIKFYQHVKNKYPQYYPLIAVVGNSPTFSNIQFDNRYML